MPYGHHTCSKSSDMAKAKVCAYKKLDHALPHWKCVMWWCAKFRIVNIHDQERYDQYSDTSPSIWFHVII